MVFSSRERDTEGVDMFHYKASPQLPLTPIPVSPTSSLSYLTSTPKPPLLASKVISELCRQFVLKAGVEVCNSCHSISIKLKAANTHKSRTTIMT